MCDLCADDGEMQSCVNCQRLICWDHEDGDDICARPGVTASGDLYCRDCAARMDRYEAAADAEDLAWDHNFLEWDEAAEQGRGHDA